MFDFQGKNIKGLLIREHNLRVVFFFYVYSKYRIFNNERLMKSMIRVCNLQDISYALNGYLVGS